MEHEYRDAIEAYGLTTVVDDARRAKFSQYVELIIAASTRFNLTGHKAALDVFSDLVLGSIAPLARLSVPRGTFVDIGTGAGVPGIPLAILYPDFTGILVDSNAKKVGFLHEVIQQLELQNLSALCARVEDVGRDPVYREHFDWVFSRAFGPIYVSIELGAPLAAVGGHYYAYSRESFGSLPATVLAHAASLGLVPASEDLCDRLLGHCDGLLFVKASRTPSGFPRRYSIIKRAAERSITPSVLRTPPPS